MNESFKKLFKKSIKKNIKLGSIIKGKIIKIKNNIVIIDAGLKSESYIPIEQFKNSEGITNIKKNDIVELSIDKIAGEWGETILSRDKAKKYETWNIIKKSYKNSLIIKGTINGKVKGGLTVDIEGIKAFLPGSLIDIKQIKNTSNLQGKKLEFKIIKLDEKKNNIVLSRKAVILSENNQERKKLLKNIKKGAILEGTVKNLTDYGAFIDLGIIDGLLHITDISWKRIKHPKEIIKIGDKIKTKIIKFDKKKTRVSLGLKQLTKDPWDKIDKKYPPKTKIKGKITNLTDYGCFIEIKEGIEGLVHISEMDWKNKNINPFKIFKIGDITEAIILNIDKKKRRISLGIKQCKINPWIEFIKKHKKGDIITGIIKSITNFGIFLKINNNIDGLIYLSDLSWLKINEKEIKNKYKKGNKIKASIIQIDSNKERVSLSVKKLQEDPLKKYIKFKEKNKLIKTKVTKINEKNIYIISKDGIEGYIKIDKEKNKKIIKNIKVGDKLKNKIIDIDIKKRIINLNIYINKKNIKKINKKQCFSTMIEAFKKAKINK